MSDDNQNETKTGETPGIVPPPQPQEGSTGTGEQDKNDPNHEQKEDRSDQPPDHIEAHPEEGRPTTLTPPVEERRDPERMAEHEKTRQEMSNHELGTENIALNEQHGHAPVNARASQGPAEDRRIADPNEDAGGDRFIVHNVTHGKHNRTERKTGGRERGVHFIGMNQIRLGREPVSMSKEQVLENIDQLIELQARNVLEVKTPEGGKVDLQDLSVEAPRGRTNTQSREPLDSVNNDKNFKFPPGYVHQSAVYGDETTMPQVLGDGQKPSLFALASDQALVAASAAQQAGMLLPNEDAEHLAAQKRAGEAASRATELAAIDEANEKHAEGKAFRAGQVVGLMKDPPESEQMKTMSPEERQAHRKEMAERANQRAVDHVEGGNHRVHGHTFEEHPENLPKDPRNANPVTSGLHTDEVEDEQDDEEDDEYENPEDHPEAGVEPREGEKSVLDEQRGTGNPVGAVPKQPSGKKKKNKNKSQAPGNK